MWQWWAVMAMGCFAAMQLIFAALGRRGVDVTANAALRLRDRGAVLPGARARQPRRAAACDRRRRAARRCGGAQLCRQLAAVARRRDGAESGLRRRDTRVCKPRWSPWSASAFSTRRCRGARPPVSCSARSGSCCWCGDRDHGPSFPYTFQNARMAALVARRLPRRATNECRLTASLAAAAARRAHRSRRRATSPSACRS